ncbi:MAG: FG-GAP repeat protein [Balneolaceae bacterium]|nr:FG-GAP repeat protein [Balneolaceae bacterium]
MVKHYLATIIFWGLILMMGSCAEVPRIEFIWQQANDYRWSVLDPGSGSVGFQEKSSSQTGISFANNLTEENITENRHYLNGSGVALADVDGDGWTDISLDNLTVPTSYIKTRAVLSLWISPIQPV